MDDTTPFAAKLRALSKDASPGPWDADRHGDIYDGDSGLRAEAPEPGDAALITTLRNHADRLADLVERVEAYRAANLAIVHHEVAATMGFPEPMRAAVAARDKAVAAMLAALDALDGGGA